MAHVLEYSSGNQGRKNERDCLRPLSGEVRHKNANPPSERGYERVGKIFSGRSKRRASVWERCTAEKILGLGMEGDGGGLAEDGER